MNRETLALAKAIDQRIEELYRAIDQVEQSTKLQKLMNFPSETIDRYMNGEAFDVLKAHMLKQMSEHLAAAKRELEAL
jgi:Mg/Co/Ni transporter MgtE